ncbi:hypothetical protein E4U43_007447 [Claviceps pusilla]|uniref:Uncharacterized protein n=1 Tax=Claviceps pusilla TaxID=123648 RepID=A0A9P7NEG4_9HYPO|nr:hypothetical protein E4U43_007447 [Claviceps pusilla]
MDSNYARAADNASIIIGILGNIGPGGRPLRLGLGLPYLAFKRRQLLRLSRQRLQLSRRVMTDQSLCLSNHPTAGAVALRRLSYAPIPDEHVVLSIFVPSSLNKPDYA